MTVAQGDRIADTSWPKGTFLTVEWFNDRYAAGTMSPSGEKKSFDLEERSFLPYVEPPATPPAPKRYVVEHRCPKFRESYLSAIDGKQRVAPFDFTHNAHSVIVAELPDTFVVLGTEARTPRKGELYTFDGVDYGIVESHYEDDRFPAAWDVKTITGEIYEAA